MGHDALLAAAAWAGRHALPLFVALLGALLLGLALLGRLWRQRLWPRARDVLPRPALLLSSLGIGLALLLGAAALFAEIADELGDGELMARLDDALMLALRAHVDSRTLQFFRALTRLGDSAWLVPLTLVVALALWWRDRGALALAWLVVLGGNALSIPLLKRIFERVRPLHEHGLVSESGFSFPSGHAAGATVVYGMLAYLALRMLSARWHGPAALLAVALAITVGASRVFLQVHYASDVLAGFAWGSAWLVVSVLAIELSRRWRGSAK